MEAYFSQPFCTHIRSDTADNNQRVQAAFFHVLDSHFTDVLFTKLRETRRTEESTATVNHVGYAIAIQLNHVVFIQTQVTVIYAKKLQTSSQRCTNKPTNGCGHARRITAACQHTDYLNHDYL